MSETEIPQGVPKNVHRKCLRCQIVFRTMEGGVGHCPRCKKPVKPPRSEVQ